MHIISYLKQARRRVNLTLQDMAYLLDMDFSNLSKYETGKKPPPARIIIAYHIVTKTPLNKLFKYSVLEMMDRVSSKTKALISELEAKIVTSKLKKRMAALYNVLNTIVCLQGINDIEHDDE